MDIGCPICGKHEYPDHELAEIKEPTLTERLEYAEALSKDNE